MNSSFSTGTGPLELTTSPCSSPPPWVSAAGTADGSQQRGSDASSRREKGTYLRRLRHELDALDAERRGRCFHDEHRHLGCLRQRWQTVSRQQTRRQERTSRGSPETAATRARCSFFWTSFVSPHRRRSFRSRGGLSSREVLRPPERYNAAKDDLSSIKGVLCWSVARSLGHFTDLGTICMQHCQTRI